eukprot:scaffold86223_cov33-Tisochrysis_lutea.AAC.3
MGRGMKTEGSPGTRAHVGASDSSCRTSLSNVSGGTRTLEPCRGTINTAPEMGAPYGKSDGAKLQAPPRRNGDGDGSNLDVHRANGP